MSQSVATAELRDKAGTQFDPDVIAALLVLLEE
jgi:HD-GYP domain-containing protein (c-di-GMP phosphodiesterase class II)